MAYGFYHDEAAELPHKPIPLAMFLIVEEALRVSWDRLKARMPARIDILTATEDELTHDFYEVIYDEVFDKDLVDGFDTEHFKVVTREKKIRNFDGGHLDKMPDLFVEVAGRNPQRKTQDGIFIECKPIGADHTVGVHYGAKGIARFVRGEYAWAMTSALMVGYASGGYAIHSKLFDALSDRAAEFEVQQHPKPCARSKATKSAECVHTTLHGRTFSYVENNQPAPPIGLRHLWLKRN